MTIEYLRARLLSERSVSSSARQRADELAKRVAELEEQLKIVTLQRKRAEKATADVLAILENQGISDVSEECDLSSDQETPSESKVVHKAAREEVTSINSQDRRHKLEELSGSDLDSSPVRGRSLSWKGRNESSRSLQRYKDSSMRRRSSVASTGSSSPKHCIGKSCRKIRHREAGSVVQEFKTGPDEVGSEENGVATIQGNVVNNNLDCNKCGRAQDMEKALEDQAQLIGCHEAMEKAQREWEEKFRENNTSTPDSCDPGNRSDTTEERDDVKEQAPYPAETVAPNGQDLKSERTNVLLSKEPSKSQPNGVLPPSQTGSLQNESASSGIASEPIAQEFAFPTTRCNQNQGSIESYRHEPPSSSNHETLPHGSHEKQYAYSPSSDGGSSFRSRDIPRSQNNPYALVPHEPAKGLGSVLEALKQAKVSLEHKINRAPSMEVVSVSKGVEPSVRATKNLMEIPVGCAGLFRLPTDFLSESATQTNFPGSRSSTSNYYPNRGALVSAGDRSVISPSLEVRPGFSTPDHYLTSGYANTLSRVYTGQPQFSPYLDGIMPSSSQSTQPAYTTYPSSLSRPSYPSVPAYPELRPQMPSNERFQRTFPSRAGGVPPADGLFHADHSRPNTYRF